MCRWSRKNRPTRRAEGLLELALPTLWFMMEDVPMKPLTLALLMLFGLFASTSRADESASVAQPINALGLDLYRSQGASGNLLLSPYSIQSALGMTYVGAEGETRAEMQRVLHYPKADGAWTKALAELEKDLRAIAAQSVERVKRSKEYGGPTTPTEFNLANRLFLHRQAKLRSSFLATVKADYAAEAEPIDFGKEEAARKRINGWVEKETKEKIRDLIGPGVLNADTRLVLANALYLRAPWADPFQKEATKPAPFYLDGKTQSPVPTMVNQSHCGFAQKGGYKMISRPYSGAGLQFLIILPDEPDGLAKVEASLTAEVLASGAKMESREVILHLPKFRIEPESLPLSQALQRLGMKTAFDQPKGSANFDRMAPKHPDDYLYISEVVHKTFLALDEAGTEAAAATAVMMALAGSAMVTPPKPLEVHVDRPFVFAVQHRATGACLFLGRVMNPEKK